MPTWAVTCKLCRLVPYCCEQHQYTWHASAASRRQCCKMCKLDPCRKDGCCEHRQCYCCRRPAKLQDVQLRTSCCKARYMHLFKSQDHINSHQRPILLSYGLLYVSGCSVVLSQQVCSATHTTACGVATCKLKHTHVKHYKLQHVCQSSTNTQAIPIWLTLTQVTK